MHVDSLVVLVNNLKAENGLDDILKGHDALETTVLVNDKGHLLTLLQKLLPDLAEGILFVEIRDRTLDLLKALVELIVRKPLKSVRQKDIASDISFPDINYFIISMSITINK